jgi:hypothetical protein
MQIRQTKLEIVGSDRQGIVREITSARLQLPEHCYLAALKQDLE